MIFAEFACKVVKIKRRECFISLNEYKAKKEHNQGFGNRSSRSRMLFKIGALKNSAILTKKRMCWSLQHTCFLVNIVKLLRTSFLQNTSGSCLCSKHIEKR